MIKLMKLMDYILNLLLCDKNSTCKYFYDHIVQIIRLYINIDMGTGMGMGMDIDIELFIG